MKANVFALAALLGDLYQQLTDAEAERDGLRAKNAELHKHIAALEKERATRNG